MTEMGEKRKRDRTRNEEDAGEERWRYGEARRTRRGKHTQR